MKLDRRNFIQFAAGGALGAGAGGALFRGIGSVQAAIAGEEVRVAAGPERWSLGTCTMCGAGCGLRVRTIGDRAVKVQGNPLHPVNRGGLCPKGLSLLQELYHPDRLRRPLRNTGSRRSPRWREVSWEEAIALLTSRLRELQSFGRASSAVLLERDRRTLASRLRRRFMKAYGSEQCLVMPSGADALQTAVQWQQGISRPAGFSFDETRYVLSFGAGLLEGWGSPTAMMRAFGRWRDASAGRRTKVVQVEPRLSVTAARADEWVPLKPGTEAALALGVAFVLISEGLCDTAFLRDHSFGFEDWRDAEGRAHRGFRTLVLSEYRLDEVAATTGVPPETIIRLAREFAANRPAVAIGDRQSSMLAGNPFAAMAVHSLNAMVGSIDTPGGVTFLPENPHDGTPESAAVNTWNLPAQAGAYLLHDVDPVFSLPGGAGARMLQDAPFAAVFSSFANDTTELCDLVLPAPTPLEQWQASASAPAFSHALFSLTPPVLAPRHQIRPSTDVFLEVARRLRGAVAAALPFTGFEQYLKAEVVALASAGTGSVFNTGLEETWNRMLERSGWWSPTWSGADQLWEQMKEKGGWWDAFYSYGQWDSVFRTRSGRFEFYSQALADWTKKNPARARAAGIDSADDRSFLPHQPALEKADSARPLRLAPFEVLPFAGGSGAHLPYLQQIAGVHLEEAWESWLEIHPHTAQRLGIADGDRVWVETARGRAQARARYYEGIDPESVYLPVGYGHRAGSQWGREGVNPIELVEIRREPVSGLPQVWDTPVRVSRNRPG